MIEFHNPHLLHHDLAAELNAAIERVRENSQGLLGVEVEAFEADFARWHGVRHAIGVASGLDAIELALGAGGIGRGDEVITVAHSSVATVSGIERSGATPIFVDVDPITYTIDPAACWAAITPRTRAIVPVHLYGHPADMKAIMEIADHYHLLVVEDCAQALGARLRGELVGTQGHLAAFCFNPSKNLGALAEAGAVLTNHAHLADRLRRLRDHAPTESIHHHDRAADRRLDDLQAAILRVKLPHLDEHNAARRHLAACYQQFLTGVAIPRQLPTAGHAYQRYVVRHRDRDGLQAWLSQRGIETQVHYPVPIHLQPAFAGLGLERGSLPVTVRLADEVLSLPMYVGLRKQQIELIADVIREFRVGAAPVGRLIREAA